MPRRFIITFAREPADAPQCLVADVWVLVLAAVLLAGSPIAVVVGASWGTKVLVADLLRKNAALEMENASYRDATTELVTQVATLQLAAEALGARAELDPEVAKAVDRLPSSITNRAMGGDSASTDFTGSLTSALGSVDPAFGLLRDILHIVERRVEHARSDVERREALAAATPSIWPVTGWLSSTFGSRTDPFGGSADFHTGIDIAADAGEPVRASGDGLVTTAQASGNHGRLVVLDHGFGIATRYGHLSRFAVTEGQQVRKGDIIGYVGSTGRSTSPHLHYELLLNGRQANPLRFLTRPAR